MYPTTRMRRLRENPGVRALASETALDPSKLILPVFFDERLRSVKTTESMPGVPTYPLGGYAEIGERLEASGVKAVLVFGIPSKKDPLGSGAHAKDGVVQKAVRGLKEETGLTVITDLCLCEYTDHGHCGPLKHGSVDNDKTLAIYGKTALSQAAAGADMVAPSGMMDGQVAAIRSALDGDGFDRVPIMAYSAKFESAFYGPFRDVACSAPGEGDRSGYQMQCGNRREAMREIELDVMEGADVVMVKPAMPYLDVIREARDRFDVPIAAYQVSGEYAMIRAAAANGWIDGNGAIVESLLSIGRAGADMIITYFAEEAATLLGDAP